MQYDRHMLLVVYAATMTALALWAMGCCAGRCGSAQPATADTAVVRTVDTVTVVLRDTVPQVRAERVLKYVSWEPAAKPPGTLKEEPAEKPPGTVKEEVGEYLTEGQSVEKRTDSVAVVQKEYTDDSTYTAYVSGICFDGYPKLDSIRVKRHVVTERIKETVTIAKKTSRWKVGFQAGYGYGLISGRFEPYVGVGIGYNF